MESQPTVVDIEIELQRGIDSSFNTVCHYKILPFSLLRIACVDIISRGERKDEARRMLKL